MSARSRPSWTSFGALPRAHGGPLDRGRLRVQHADFQVEERLGFAPDGVGDHLLLRVRKVGANTEWVARRLAALVEAPGSAVGYAGLKDRHAVASQWFSVPRPRRSRPDWSALTTDGIQVLEVHPHRRKLRRGVLAGNRFRILVRDAGPAIRELDARLDLIRARGVPNYFGEQRFGHDEGNLVRAQALFQGTAGRATRQRRGLWLSAARSQVFNQLLAERVRRGDWDRPQPGDCLALEGCHSYFPVDRVDETLRERCAGMDLHPSGPLWGAGVLPTHGEVRALEEGLAARFGGWTQGLADFGLKQERRALRLPVAELSGRRRPEGLELSFELPPGSYATAVLREILEWESGATGGSSSEKPTIVGASAV